MTRLRRQEGFTLPELLIALSMSLIVALAAFALIETVMKRTGEVDARVDATQHARLIMDTVTRELRSQVCLDANTPAMATRAGDVTDGNDAVFYADLTADTPTQLAAKPGADLHKLSYNAATEQIIDTTYASTWDKSGAVPVAAVGATPTSTRIIANDVIANGGPIFTYYGYDGDTPPAADQLLGDSTGRALTVAELGLVARIDINLMVLPTHGQPGARGAVAIQDQVYVRAADPNDDAPTPTCA